MVVDRIEGKWIELFAEVFGRCKVGPGDACAVLSESQSRALNVQLAELALLRLGARPFHVMLPTPRQTAAVPIKSTGASVALQGMAPAIAALAGSVFVADCTVEGLMHAAELPQILKGGARVLYITNEHPEVLERLAPSPADEQQVRAGMRQMREAKATRVTSPAGPVLASLLTATLALFAAQEAASQPAPQAGACTLAVLPDTQNYSLKYPGLFTAQTGWILQNRARLDIRYVPKAYRAQGSARGVFTANSVHTEPFTEGQKGSSARPHKRNPVSCEHVCGLARLVRTNALAALENVAL